VSKKNVFITGVTGYIGHQLLQTHLQQPKAIRVFGLSRSTPTNYHGWHPFQGDIFDPELPKLLQEIQPDIIFHTVAAPTSAPLETQLKTNVLGTEYLLQSVLESQIQTKVVVLGSAAEYGLREGAIDEAAAVNPQSDYGVAKVAQSLTALNFGRQFHIPVVVARIFNVYGQTSTKLSIASLASQIAKQEKRPTPYPKVKAYNLQSRRDFIHIDDVVSALMALGEAGQPGEIYNIGTGVAISLQVVLDKLLNAGRLRTVDILKSGDQVLNTSIADIRKIVRDTRWQPMVSLDAGLRRELDYWREEHQLLAF